MRTRKTVAIAGSALLAAFAAALARPVEHGLRDFDRSVAMLHGAFAARPENPESIEWARRALRHMVEVDQYAREFAETQRARAGGLPERLYFTLRFQPRAVEIERRHVALLEALLERYGWIRRSRFGAQADHHAWLLAHHADVHPEFQQRVLALLATQWTEGETAPEHYARLFDRVEARQGRPQRYGTQGQCTGLLRWEPRPIEDPERLDERRREMGLGAFEAQRARRARDCSEAEPYKLGGAHQQLPTWASAKHAPDSFGIRREPVGERSGVVPAAARRRTLS